MDDVLRLRVPVLAVVVVALLLPANPAPASDGAGAEGLGLQVSSGHAPGQANGGWMPVTVTLSPRRPVVATLEVSASSADGVQVQRRDIELRAGATAVYRVVLPTGSAQVTVHESGGEPVTARPPAQSTAADDVVIGLLDGTTQPPPVSDPVTERSGTWAPVDRRWLAFGAPALASLSALAVDEAVLAELDDRAIRTLEAATAGGMDLVVVATDPGPVDLRDIAGEARVSVTERADDADLRSVESSAPAWPVSAADVWRDGDPETTVALSMARGRGRVNVVTVAPGPGEVAGATRLWRLLTLGRPPSLQNDARFAPDGSAASSARLADAFADDTTSDPSLPWLAAFLIAYIVVVGPVSGALLAHRKRRELTWVTVPAVAIVFTLATVIGVPGARPLREERGALRWWLDGAGEHLVLAGVRSPTEGVRDVRIPGDGWTLRTIARGPDGASVRTAGGDTIVGLSLQSLAFGGVIASRPATEAPPLHVDPTVDGDRVVVTVRNDGPELLTRVDVRIGAAQRPIGTLDPGGTAEVVFTEDALPEVAPYTLLHDGDVRTGTAEDLVTRDLGALEPGIVWAVGDAGHTTLLVGRRPVPLDDAMLTPPAVQRALMTGLDGNAGQFLVEGAQGVVRLRVPADMAPDRLEDRLGDERLEIWDWSAETWVPRESLFDGGAGDADGLLSPTGELYVRNANADTFAYARSSIAAAGAGTSGPSAQAASGEDAS